MRRAVMGIAASMLIAIATACGGDGTKTISPQGGSATATRDMQLGVPLLTSTITVRFDRPVELATDRVPLASYFELDLPYATVDSVKSERVQVQSAEFTAGSTREVTLKIARLVPAGATLFVRKEGFERDLEGSLELEVKSDLDVIGVLFASEALGVADPVIVDSGAVPLATDADRDTAAQREALVKHMTDRGTEAETQQRALATYDAMSTTIVPSPKARAALSALTGTFAEDAITSLLTAENCTGKPAASILFQVPPGAQQLFARVTYARDGSRIVSLNPTLEGERIEALMPILLHEAIHCDQAGGRFEEVAATAIDTYMWINLIATFPELSRSMTPLTKELNVDAIAMINSGRKIPESVGILKSPGVEQAVPGTNAPHTNFADMVAAAYPGIDYNESPDEPLAQAYIAQLAPVADMQVGPAFNLVYLDELLSRIAPPELVQLAAIALDLAPEE